MSKILRGRRTLAALLLLVLASLCVGAGTFGKPNVKVTLSGTVNRGGQEIQFDSAGTIRPGEIITWRIVAMNVGDAPALGLNLVGDVYDGTVFVAGSVGGDGLSGVKYSLEHPHENQSFSERPMVRYSEGGQMKERPATPEEYKAVQLTFANIGAGGTVTATYRTRVR